MKKRKAQGLSMNVIIIAAIALLVLVILAIIFIGRMGKTASTVDQCQGECVYGSSNSDCQKLGSYYKKTGGKCLDSNSKPDKTKVCCVGVSA